MVPQTWFLNRFQPMQGVFLRKNVIEIAGRALNTNIRALAPRVLPWIEQAAYPPFCASDTFNQLSSSCSMSCSPSKSNSARPCTPTPNSYWD